MPAIVQGGPTTKPAIPSPVDRQRASKSIKDIYGSDLAAAKTPNERLALARKILQTGVEEKSDLSARYVLLSLAQETAESAGDLTLAEQAVDALTQTFELDAPTMEADSAISTARSQRSPVEQKAFSEQADGLAKTLFGQEQFDAANRVAESELSAAKEGDDQHVVERARLRLAQIQEAQAQAVNYRREVKTLASAPKDAEANLVVGRFRCLIEGRWSDGLPLLAGGSDATLKQLAHDELSHPSDADASTKIADGWWAIADKNASISRIQAELHAVDWYQKALPSLTGLQKVKVEKRIQEAAPALANAADQQACPTSQPAAVVGGDDTPTQGQPKLTALTLLRAVDLSVSAAGDVTAKLDSRSPDGNDSAPVARGEPADLLFLRSADVSRLHDGSYSIFYPFFDPARAQLFKETPANTGMLDVVDGNLVIHPLQSPPRDGGWLTSRSFRFPLNASIDVGRFEKGTMTAWMHMQTGVGQFKHLYLAMSAVPGTRDVRLVAFATDLRRERSINDKPLLDTIHPVGTVAEYNFKLPFACDNAISPFGLESGQGDLMIRSVGIVADVAARLPISVIDQNGQIIVTQLMNSPAKGLGIQTQDQILAVNSNPVATQRDMFWAVGQNKPGDAIPVEIQRGGNSNTIKLVGQ